MSNIKFHIFSLILFTSLICKQIPAQVKGRNDLLIIKSLNKSQRYTEALNFINDSINLNNVNTDIAVESGRTFINLSNYEKAINLFLIANRKKSNIALLELAECYSYQNKSDSATEYLAKYLSKSDKYEISLIKSNPAFNKIANTKEWINLWNNDWYSPIELNINDASYEYRIGNYDESIKLLENIITKRPNNHLAYHLLALNYEKLNDNKYALKLLLQAIKLSANDATYLFDCSRITFKLEKFNQAKSYINEALAVDSSEIDYYIYRSKINLKLNNKTEAENDIQLILRFVKNVETLQIAGNIYYESQDYLTALKYYNQAIQIESYNPDIYLDRAKTYYASGMSEYAEKDFTMTLDFYPTNGEIYYLRALSRINQKKYDSACSDLKKAKLYGYVNAEEALKRYCQHDFD